LKVEAETVKARMEHEFRMRDIEVRNRNSGAGGDAEDAQDRDNNNGHGSRSAGMKALKLPPFNEEKDDLDAYLTRFERACVAFEVRRNIGQPNWQDCCKVKRLKCISV